MQNLRWNTRDSLRGLCSCHLNHGFNVRLMLDDSIEENRYNKTASPWLRIQSGKWRQVETKILWKLQNFHIILFYDSKHVKILFHYVWMRHVLNMFFSSHHVWKSMSSITREGVETHSRSRRRWKKNSSRRLNVKKWNLRIWKQQQ